MIVALLILFIITGQIIKIPLGEIGGPSLLDLLVLVLDMVGLYRVKLNLKNPPSFIKAGLIFSVIALLTLLLTPLDLNYLEYLNSFFYNVRFLSLILLGWLIFSGAFVNFNKEITKILIFSGVILAILGLLQYIFLPDLSFLQKEKWDPHFGRTVSTFLDPNFIGAFFVLTMLSISKKSAGNLTILIFTLAYLGLLTTFSRSSYAMFFTSFTTLAILLKSYKLLILTVILTAVLILGFMSYTQTTTKQRNIDRGQSAVARLNTWQQGLQIFLDNPLKGVGFNSYRYALREYKLSDREFLNMRGSTSNDSSLLHVAATTGIIGLTSYLAFLLLFIKQGRKNLVLWASICGLIIHSFFANSLFYPPILLWLILTSVQES